VSASESRSAFTLGRRRLTIVIPTLGRPTLARTVFSFLGQLEDGDEVILVADPKGDVDYVKWMRESSSNRLGVEWRHVVHDGPGGWGLPQRNRGLELATRDLVWFLADDDIATPWALDAIRSPVAPEGRWRIFRVGRANDEPWIWVDREIRRGNLDADCIVCPSGVSARWGPDYTGDYDFAVALHDELGPPVFCQDIVAVTKPDADYLARHYRALGNALAEWHDARPDSCCEGGCCAHSEGMRCCIDDWLGTP
jgi:glycosyltransferase involved in cell wall biosynthesis